MNSFGRNFRVTVFGESHGPAIGVVIDGVQPGIPLSTEDFEGDLARRRGVGCGVSCGALQPAAGGHDDKDVRADRILGTTSRREKDIPEIVSGVFDGHTTGAPLAVLFRNEDVRSGDYAPFADHPRPSHADMTARQKFGGHNDPRGGGHFSGRLTLCLVAAGVVAKKMLMGSLEFSSEIIEIGGSRDPLKFEKIVTDAMSDGDSVGGVIECRAAGVKAGLGEPFFDSVESLVAHLMFAIPGVKGVEFGSGFAGAAKRGSENNDPIVDEWGTTKTNNSGGIDGGVTSGNPIVVRVAVKPTASIARRQQTYNFATGRPEPLKIAGRHDACIALRAGVVAEAALAIVLADLVAPIR